jgi:hypothetical protein
MPRGRERRKNTCGGREERRTAAGLQSTWNLGDLPETLAEGRLFTKHSLDGALWVKGWRREVITPSVQGGEDRPGDGWVAVGAVEVPTQLLEGVLPDRCHLGSGAMSDVLGGFVRAKAARALGHVPGFDLVHLVADATEARGMFDLEPVGGQGGGMGGTFLVLPIDDGRVAGTKSLFLLPVCEGTGNGGDLEKGRWEG